MTSLKAMWKGVIEFGPVSVPVKLYPAVEDKSVSFRLLERTTAQPVRQVLLNPKTNEIVEHEDTERGFVTGAGQLVSLDSDELTSLEPVASRVIAVRSFLPAGTIDYRWYLRPYYLGPDSDDDGYFTLVAALGRVDMEGVAHWVMRDKEYVGALRLHRGYPMLVTLRNAEEVPPLDDLGPPTDDDLDAKQMTMAAQLIAMLSDDFEPDRYPDEHRENVLDLIARKKRGAVVRKSRPRGKKATTDVTAALEKSLSRGKKAGVRSGSAGTHDTTRTTGTRSSARG